MNRLTDEKIAELADETQWPKATLEDVHDMARELKQWREAAKKPVAHVFSHNLERLSEKGAYVAISPHGGNGYDIPLYAAPPTITVKLDSVFRKENGKAIEVCGFDNAVEAIRTACAAAGIQCVIEGD